MSPGDIEGLSWVGSLWTLHAPVFFYSHISRWFAPLPRLQVDWSLPVKPCKAHLPLTWAWGGMGRGFLQDPFREGLDQSGCQSFTPLAGGYGRPHPLNILTEREEKRRNKVSEDED